MSLKHLLKKVSDRDTTCLNDQKNFIIGLYDSLGNHCDVFQSAPIKQPRVPVPHISQVSTFGDAMPSHDDFKLPTPPPVDSLPPPPPVDDFLEFNDDNNDNNAILPPPPPRRDFPSSSSSSSQRLPPPPRSNRSSSIGFLSKLPPPPPRNNLPPPPPRQPPRRRSQDSEDSFDIDNLLRKAKSIVEEDVKWKEESRITPSYSVLLKKKTIISKGRILFGTQISQSQLLIYSAIQVAIIDINTYQVVERFRAISHYTNSTIAYQNRHLFFCTSNNRLVCFNIDTKKKAYDVPTGLTGLPSSVCLSPNGKLMFICTRDKFVSLWKVPSNLDSPCSLIKKTKQNIKLTPKSSCFNSNGTSIFVGSISNSIYEFTLGLQLERTYFSQSLSTIIQLSCLRSVLMAGQRDGTVSQFLIGKPSPVSKFKQPHLGSFTLCGREMFVGTGQGSFAIYSRSTRNVIKSVKLVGTRGTVTGVIPILPHRKKIFILCASLVTVYETRN